MEQFSRSAKESVHWFERHNSYSNAWSPADLRPESARDRGRCFAGTKAFTAADFNVRAVFQNQKERFLSDSPFRPLVKVLLLHYFYKRRFSWDGRRGGFNMPFYRQIYAHMIVAESP